MDTTLTLSDEQWAVIAANLPRQKTGRGRPRADDRRTVEGILYVLQSGCTWNEMPRSYGSPATCWRRFKGWSADGTWQRIWKAYLSRLDETERQTWVEAFLEGRFIPARSGE